MVYYEGAPELENAIAKHRNYIAGETLAKSIERDQLQGPGVMEYNIEEWPIKLSIRKCQT